MSVLKILNYITFNIDELKFLLKDDFVY